MSRPALGTDTTAVDHHPPPPWSLPPWRKPILVWLAFALVAACLYAPSLSNEFINWDDGDYILRNPELRLPLAKGVQSMFSSLLLSNYNPLHRLSYYIDWSLSGGQPWFFRLVSLLFHVVNAGLVYQLLRVWMKRHSVAVIGAALFLVVPANVESVAWVSERKTLLATFFGLASMILWLRDRRHLALACFAAGLLAKTSIIVLPGLLVLLDLQQGKGFRWRAYAAFTLPAIALAPVQLIAVSDLGPTPLHGGTAWTHVGTCLAALPTYIANAVTPFGHLPKHPFEPVTSFADLRLWLGILTWSAVGYGMWRSFRGERRFLAAGGFALAAIYLTIIVPIPIIVADRYLYLALPLLLGVCVAWFLDSSIGARRAARYLAVVWVASIMVGTFSYAGAWNNSISLWTYALERRPTDREAWISLAAAHGENQDMVAAAKVLELTVQRFPDFGNAVVNLASLEVHLGRSADAIRRLESLLAKDRQYPQAWCALAVVYTTQNQPEAAARVFREGSDLCPGYLPLAKNHVQFRLTRGEWAEARTIAERFHTANPDDKAGRAALDRMIRAVAPR